MYTCICHSPYTINGVHFPCGTAATCIELPGGLFILKSAGKVIAVLPPTTFFRYFRFAKKAGKDSDY